MDIREQKQKEAEIAVVKANYIAAVEASVGFGKGRLMVNLLLRLIREKGIKSILYLCDNRRLRDSDFPAELEKWGTPELKKMVRLECYQTTYKWIGQSFDVVLGDEIDFAITKEYIKVFFNNHFTYKILVTGTLNNDKRKILLTIAPIVYRITTTQAEQAGLLNKSNYYIVNYAMTEEESKQYRKWCRALAAAMGEEKPQATIDYLMRQRFEVLANLESSVRYTKKVLDYFYTKKQDMRAIVFCQRKAQADKICKYSYHGDNEHLNHLEKFKQKLIRAIAVVSKVTRGINLPQANTGIFEMLNGASSTPFEQRNGRLKRLPTNQVADIVILCPWEKTHTGEYRPTIVKTWIDKATANLGVEFQHLKL